MGADTSVTAESLAEQFKANIELSLSVLRTRETELTAKLAETKAEIVKLEGLLSVIANT